MREIRQERRRIRREEEIAECRHHLPAKMNKGDGEVVLTLLYKIGTLTSYLDDVDETLFSYYFDFEDDVKLDSEGRITFLEIDCHQCGDNNLPSIIERLQKLQRIELRYCLLLPIELGNLPLLKSITFHGCDLESIPEGLLLSSLKQVKISGIRGSSSRSLSAFWNIFPDTLEELTVSRLQREQADEILCALQNHDFGFRDSLTKIEMSRCELNKEDLERLLFDILPRFPNIHTLDIEKNNIKSLQGIENRIKQVERFSSTSSSSSSSSSSLPPSSQPVIPVNKLRKLILRENLVTEKISNNTDNKTTYDPKEEAALITILDAFDGIYHIGGESQLGHYPVDVEYLLRINHAGRKFFKEGAKAVSSSHNNKPVIKLALLPKILEKAHSKSAEIYDKSYVEREGENAKNRRKCATGLFHLVRHFCGPLFEENRRRRSCDNQERSATSSASSSSSSIADRKTMTSLQRQLTARQVSDRTTVTATATATNNNVMISTVDGGDDGDGDNDGDSDREDNEEEEEEIVWMKD